MSQQPSRCVSTVRRVRPAESSNDGEMSPAGDPQGMEPNHKIPPRRCVGQLAIGRCTGPCREEGPGLGHQGDADPEDDDESSNEGEVAASDPSDVPSRSCGEGGADLHGASTRMPQASSVGKNASPGASSPPGLNSMKPPAHVVREPQEERDEREHNRRQPKTEAPRIERSARAHRAARTTADRVER